jgi:hypothetical protein
MHLPRFTLVACLLSLLFVAIPAAAGDDPYDDEDDDPYAVEDAGSLFREGLASMNALDLEAACPKLDRSYHIDPRPGTLYTLAECEARRGRLVTAVAHFKQFVTLVDSSPAWKQRQYQARKEKAEKRRAEIEPSIPTLTLTLEPDAPWTTVVKLDGAAIELSALGRARGLNLGPHAITVQAPGGKLVELRVDLAKEEKKQLTLSAGLPPKPCVAPALPTNVQPVPIRGGCAGCAVGDGDVGARGASLIAVVCALACFARRRRRAPGIERTQSVRERHGLPLARGAFAPIYPGRVSQHHAPRATRRAPHG